MLIREAVPEDAAALAALIGELGYEVTLAEAAERLEAQAAGGFPVLVADDGAVVGCVSWSMMRVLHRPGPVGRASMLVVAEAVRGGGIGKALMAAVEARCRALGCVLVEVTSNLRRDDAHQFYERLGYQRTSFRFAKEP